MIRMSSDKFDLFSIVQSAGRAASDLFGKTKEAARTFIDEHGLNDIEGEDVAEAADKAMKKVSSVYEGMKTGGAQLGEKIAKAKREADLKKLQPIFAEDLGTPDFTMSRLIRLTRMDRRRASSEVCRGAVGHDSAPRDVRVVNLYTDHLSRFGLTFYPDAGSEIYYVDPSDRTKYIALDVYFEYMKAVRIAELRRIAEDLGARHFRITYREEKRALTRKPGISAAATDLERLDASGASSEVAAEADLPGHPPVRPALAYLRKDPAVQALIDLRFSPGSVPSQRVLIRLGDSSGMREKEAARIDAALDAMKCAGNATVTSEAQSESRRYLEYEIDF